MKKPKSILSALLLFVGIFAYGQAVPLQLVSSSGDTYKNSSYQLDWSIGEILTETYTSSQNTLTQGFHQGTLIITETDQLKDLQFEITAFPNPASDYVILMIAHPRVRNLRFTITAQNGKTLQNGKITEPRQQVSLAGIATGVYFLNVLSDLELLKSFKIIKSN